MNHLRKIPVSVLGEEVKDGRTSSEVFVSPNEGCRMTGYIKVSTVPGNFYVSVHNNGYLLSRMAATPTREQHTIHHLSFGEEPVSARSTPPAHALDGTAEMEKGDFTYHYFLDVVPTLHQATFATSRAYQYTSHSSETKVQRHRQMSTAVFRHQLSPIAVKYSSGRVLFVHFVTYVCVLSSAVSSLSLDCSPG